MHYLIKVGDKEGDPRLLLVNARTRKCLMKGTKRAHVLSIVQAPYQHFKCRAEATLHFESVCLMNTSAW